MRIILFFCIALLLTSCASVEDSIEDIGATLPSSTPEQQGINSAGLENFIVALEEKVDAVHSVMVIRHGKVVAEGWWAPYRAEDQHVMYSVTKSVVSTAVGFAQQEGLLNVNDMLISYFPELTPENISENLKNMRIRDLLTMTTGHNEGTMNPMRASANGDYTQAFLSLEVEHKPGTFFKYNSGASYMLSALVQKVSGLRLEVYLKPRLFDPLGIEPPLWGISPEGVNLAGALYFKTEDLAKLALLYLQKGMWNGERLLDESWVLAATSAQVSNGSNVNSNWEHGYGYQFWQNKVTGFRADGALGQFGFVFPEYDTVLVITSGTDDMHSVMEVVWDKFIPALNAGSLPENTKANVSLSRKLSSLEMPKPQGSKESKLADFVSGKRYAFKDNSQAIASIVLDFNQDKPLLVIHDADGVHSIPVGMGEWLHSQTRFKKRVNDLFVVNQQNMAASGAWVSENNFVVQLCFNDTPYILTASFSFKGDQLLLDMGYNVRWGEKQYPQLEGYAR